MSASKQPIKITRLLHKLSDGTRVEMFCIGELALFIGGSGVPYFYVVRSRVVDGISGVMFK